jgi:hypothetical protein
MGVQAKHHMYSDIARGVKTVAEPMDATDQEIGGWLIVRTICLRNQRYAQSLSVEGLQETRQWTIVMNVVKN